MARPATPHCLARTHVGFCGTGRKERLPGRQHRVSAAAAHFRNHAQRHQNPRALPWEGNMVRPPWKTAWRVLME